MNNPRKKNTGIPPRNPNLRFGNDGFIPKGIPPRNPNLRFGNDGFTFIEILVFTAIISFLFIAMTSTVINSLQRMQITEHRLYANRYAEELVEWLRAEKDDNWETFYARDTGSGSGTFYCFNEPLTFTAEEQIWPEVSSDAECLFDGIGSTPPQIYRRYAMITAVPPEFNQVNIQVIVEWKEGNKFFTAPLNTVFTNIDENIPSPTPTP